MEIRHLRLVKSIVEEGSITKAIDKLHLTQSALSHQLKEAEEQLGTKIFHRINKKLILTKAGEKLYETAIDVLHKLADTKSQIKNLVYGEHGEIRISTECYTSYYWLPGLIREFQVKYPNVELKILMEGFNKPVEKLLDGRLDVIVTIERLTEDHVEYRELFQDEIVAIVPDTHPWAEKKYVNPEDFRDQHLIIHSMPMNSVAVHQYFLEPAGVTPKKVSVLPFTEAAVQMVNADMGIVAMARWILKPYLKTPSIRTVKLGKNGLKRMHYVGFLKNRERPNYFDSFIEFMQREINIT